MAGPLWEGLGMSEDTGPTDESADPRRIVVGYGGSEGCEPALDWAIETARREQRPLSILHCYDLAHVPVVGATLPDAQGELMSRVADEVLGEVIARAAQVLGESQVSGKSVLGSPAGELVAESETAHLVVSGSHGKGRLLAGLLGSTSYAVTAHAKCPAVVVRGDASLHPDPGHRVVVGVDESEESVHALDRAAEVAESSGAPLHLVRGVSPHVEAYVHPEIAPMVFGEGYALDDGQLGDQILAYAREATDEAAARLRDLHPALTVTSEVVEDDPGLAIARAGEGAGLIVVGSRGRGGFTGMLLGSVSHTVIHHATSPVMVVR